MNLVEYEICTLFGDEVGTLVKYEVGGEDGIDTSFGDVSNWYFS